MDYSRALTAASPGVARRHCGTCTVSRAPGLLQRRSEPKRTEFELKSDLPTRDGNLHPWHSGGQLGEYARNQIAEEIIAFANTLGGVVCVGITETLGHPKRANRPNPLPRVHDLARRLRQSVYEIIDPPLPVLEAAGVEFRAYTGVVLLRVPQSRRRPHPGKSDIALCSRDGVAGHQGAGGIVPTNWWVWRSKALISLCWKLKLPTRRSPLNWPKLLGAIATPHGAARGV